MRASTSAVSSSRRRLGRVRLVPHRFSAVLLVAVLSVNLLADEKHTTNGTTPTDADSSDPFESPPAAFDPFDVAEPLAAIEQSAKPRAAAPPQRLALLQAPANGTEEPDELDGGGDVAAEPLPSPCEGAAEKPMVDLGINIVLPSGLLPKNHAGECWQHLNAAGGSDAAMRCWPMSEYYWDATCLCYRPLYFEETNLERYGYGFGCECLQPVVSAAHFFGTVPALPYCMAAHCPCECEYTLGHYRSGSCPPWRCNWPPLTPIAAAAEAGVMTEFVFLIP